MTIPSPRIPPARFIVEPIGSDSEEEEDVMLLGIPIGYPVTELQMVC